MLDRLLRLPSPAFPADLATGDAAIDAHLRTLDAALAGAAAVRRQTVMEARDFLLDMREHARAAGRDDAAASREAIAALGPIEAIALEQRATRARMFRRFALGMGLGYAALMMSVEVLRAGPAEAEWGLLSLVFVVQALLFGLPMGYMAAYIFKRAEPLKHDVTASGFLVHFTPNAIRMSWGLAAFFALCGVAFVAGFAGIGLYGDWGPLALTMLMLVNLRVVIGALRAARFRALAEDDAVSIEGLFGRTRIPRASITGTARASWAMQLVIPAMGLSHWIAWRDTDGRTRRTYVSIAPDLVHGDRLVAWLESAARANTTQYGTANSRA